MTADPGITHHWLRRIRATFTGLALATDSATFTGEGKTIAYESTGRPDDLRITAQIRKHIHGIPSASQITLFNLSPETRGAFRRGGTKIRIEAGWDQGPGAGLKQCFYGSLLTAVHARAGADIATTIHAISGFDALSNENKPGTWSEGCPVRKIVEYMVEKLPGVTFDPARIKVDRTIGEKGWSWVGPPAAGLNALGREYGFSWTIVDGMFQAVGDKANFGICATLKDPYLVGVNPVLAGPLQIATGIQARCAFEAALAPAWKVAIDSKTNPKYNGGDYRITSVVHHLDCRTINSFVSDVTAFMPPGARSL
jgi:hypothetical protein